MYLHPVILTSVLLVVLASYAAIYRHPRGSYSLNSSNQEMTLDSFRPVYAFVRVSLFLATSGAFWTSSPLVLSLWRSTTIAYVGLGIALVGTSLAAWARYSLGSSYSPCFASHLPPRIVTRGPYRWVRHPLYSSNIVALAGFFIASGSLWVLLDLVLVAAFYGRAASSEEHVLAVELPGYAQYRKSTGAFVPRLITVGLSTAKKAHVLPCTARPGWLDRRRGVSSHLRQVRDAQAIAFAELSQRNEMDERTVAKLMRAALLTARALGAGAVVMASDGQVKRALKRSGLATRPAARGEESKDLLLVAPRPDDLSTSPPASAAA